jgi:DNA-binding SARP family transcriptional activator
MEGERARLAARAATAAWRLVDAEQRRGDLASAVEWARRLLSVQPDDERAVRQEISLLHMLGDRAAALRAYREFARRIAVDYELEPAAETDALVRAIRFSGRGLTQAKPPGR